MVGNALSGAFLAHGYQANRVLALDDPKVSIHAMGKAAAARVTRRSVAELERLGEQVLPLAYDVRSFARLGLLHELISGVDADEPTAGQVEHVRARIAAAIDGCAARSARSRQSAGVGRCVQEPRGVHSGARAIGT